MVDYNSWSKEQLIEKIRKLECHVKQLRNVIAKRSTEEERSDSSSANFRKRAKLELEDNNVSSEKPDVDDDGVDDESFDRNGGSQTTRKDRNKKASRPFDFTKVSMRHVALKVLYLGWDYQGLACQEDTEDTIEAHVFKALTLTRLVEDRTKSNYHRCGRTDKGVSAFSQVLSLDIRSKIVDGKETMDYCKILNRTLPKEIRVIAWSLVRPDFSARFDCCERTYKYFFPKGNLNIEKMKQAGQFLLGENDYKNFCKIDKDNPTTTRKIFSVDILHSNTSDPYQMCQLVIVGQSFLWHQIRCIVSLLVLVGKEMEEVTVIKDLLDFEKYPKKPQYSMAIDYPLVLYDVKYPEKENIQWTYSPENMTALLSDMQKMWMHYSIKSSVLRSMITDIEILATVKKDTMTDSLLMGSKRKVYIKLKNRPACGNVD